MTIKRPTHQQHHHKYLLITQESNIRSSFQLSPTHLGLGDFRLFTVGQHSQWQACLLFLLSLREGIGVSVDVDTRNDVLSTNSI